MAAAAMEEAQLKAAAETTRAKAIEEMQAVAETARIKAEEEAAAKMKAEKEVRLVQMKAEEARQATTRLVEEARLAQEALMEALLHTYYQPSPPSYLHATRGSSGGTSA